MKQEERLGPSFIQVIWSDYTAFLATFTPIVIWIVCLAWLPDWRGNGPAISSSLVSIFLLVAFNGTFIGLGFLFQRFLLVRRALLKGKQVRGKISEVALIRDRGRVEYIYIYQHKEYRSSVSIHRNQRTKALRKGEQVVLFVDPRRPRIAFIRDLYV